MDYPKFIVSSQKEESISIQRVMVCFLVPFLQDNIKLKSQVHGQESVIEGLRAERKLWGQELAQQGRQRVGCLVLQQYHYYMSLDVRKPVFRDLQTTQAQTSLRIRAVWSAPLLFVLWKVSYVNLLQVKFEFSGKSL